MFVDPGVSRVKFDREIAQFRAAHAAYHPRGAWLVDAVFPEAFFVLVAPQLKPFPLAVAGVVLNFEDYDIAPPSVRFVNPVTREPMPATQIPLPFLRMTPAVGANVPPGLMVPQQMLVAFPGGPPFLCLQGVREYHQSSAHSGDSWFLYRKTGAGTLMNLVEALMRYGAEQVRSLNFNLQIQIAGLILNDQPPA